MRNFVPRVFSKKTPEKAACQHKQISVKEAFATAKGPQFLMHLGAGSRDPSAGAVLPGATVEGMSRDVLP